MSDDLRIGLEKLVRLLAAQDEATPNDSIGDDPLAQDVIDILRDIREVPDPNETEGASWWNTTFQSIIPLLGSAAFWYLIKFLRKNGWSLRRIAELFARIKGRCPEGSTDPCCIALKKLAEILQNWFNTPDRSVPDLIDNIGAAAAVFAGISACSWLRDSLLALLQAYLRAYLINTLGLTEAQAAELIKKLLEWIMGGANPNDRPVLRPESNEPSPDSEQCKPDKDKIEQSLWEKYRDQIQNVAYALVVLAAIAAIIAGALAACGGTFVGCAGLPAAMTAIIALLASIGINIGEDEARQLMEDQASAAGCVGTGTETVMASDRIKALRAALRKKLPT